MMQNMVYQPSSAATDWTALMHELGPRFAELAAGYDAQDRFVAENMAVLKAHRVLSAGIPVEFGGGGASYREMGEMLRVLARYCGSTALVLSMHTHLVMTNVWRWRHDKAPLEALLRRVAAEDLLLVSTGGGDWLPSSGTAERVEGGWRIRARKPFASGAPVGDILMTSAVSDDPVQGEVVLHFGVPLRGENVRLDPVWHTLGMRGTGSEDVLLEGVFVPDAAIGVRRPRGKWHRLYHIVSMVALPLIYMVYIGLAEAARDQALTLAARRREDPHLPYLVGEMENALYRARLVAADMMLTGDSAEPGQETTSRILIGRQEVARAVLETIGKAMEVTGGPAFYRRSSLERIFRDAQAARFHPVQDKPQLWLTGRLALGLDIEA